MSTGCKVCDDIVLRRVVDEEFDKGGTGAYVSRLMTARGYPVSDGVVNRHRSENHRRDYEKAAPEPAVARRDAARIIKDKALDALEVIDPAAFIVSKEAQSAAKLALQAQGLEDKREVRKAKQNVVFNFFLKEQEERPLLEDPNVIDGQAVEVG